jgi:hypothetical protein
VSVVLDAGAFVAAERGDRDLIAIVKRERLENRAPLTSGGVVGQVWRGGSGRQANLARLLAGVDIQPIDEDVGKRVGLLLGAAGAEDVVDAAVVLLAHDGDEIFTSDLADLRPLAIAAGRHVELIRV